MLNYRTDAAQTGSSEISDPYWQLFPFPEQLKEAELLATTTCRVNRRDRESAREERSVLQAQASQAPGSRMIHSHKLP